MVRGRGLGSAQAGGREGEQKSSNEGKEGEEAEGRGLIP